MADLTKIYFVINGIKYELPRPPELQIQREDVYGGEYTTCTGKKIADVIGWRYSDLTLKWDALPQKYIDILVQLKGQCKMIFDAPESEEENEDIVRSTVVYLRHRFLQNGETWWKDVSVGVKYLNVHN